MWLKHNYRYLLYFGAILAGIIAFFVFVVPVWFYHPLGTQACRFAYKGNPKAIRDCIGYNYHSGLGSDLSEITLLFGVITLYIKHNCYEVGCPWVGRIRSQLDGHVRCRWHHNKHRQHPNYKDAKDLDANS